jgi:hypothetical protein
LREIIAGRNDSLFRIPGPWVSAATAARPESLAIISYVRAAARSGIMPLDGETLPSQRSQHVMGLYRRSELREAARRTLESIRAAIPSDSTRSQFDRIFRPAGQWLVDLHDAALAWAVVRKTSVNWTSARPALAGAGWLSQRDSSAAPEAIARALYALTVLAATDSIAFANARADLRRADSASASDVLLLLQGYRESQRWFADAVEFFLTRPWAADPKGRRQSLGDYVRDEWRRVIPDLADSELPVPEIRTWLFGYPQAVPHYGVPRILFDHLVQTENQAGGEWLDRNGPAALLHALRWLPPGDTSLVLLQVGSETVRLSTVPRQSRESLNGFLEPQDAIAIDPAYSPLLALGALVHEWQHIAFRRLQLVGFAAELSGSDGTIVDLPGAQPYLAEGFAEWSTERILGPLSERWPLLSLGELEKRAGLAMESADDQHSLGYALVRELARALKDPGATTRLLMRHAEDPFAISEEPLLRSAWKRYRGSRDFVFAAPSRRVLIPEVTFTIENGYPDVIATRIRVPEQSQ